MGPIIVALAVLLSWPAGRPCQRTSGASVVDSQNLGLLRTANARTVLLLYYHPQMPVPTENLIRAGTGAAMR